MPGGAKLFDKVTSLGESPLIGNPSWDHYLGQGLAELYTKKIDAP